MSTNNTKVSKESASQQEDNAWIDDFFQDFQKESDRAAVILVAAMIDNTLRKLLEAFFLSVSSSEDPLFEGSNAPLSSFSARIECTYRVGLINQDFRCGLNIMRKIRNSFAHDISGCTFDEKSVKDRVKELTKRVKLKRSDMEDLPNLKWESTRDKFCYVSGLFLYRLKTGFERITPLNDANAITCEHRRL